MSNTWLIIFLLSFVIGYILSMILADVYNYSVGFISLFSFACAYIGRESKAFYKQDYWYTVGTEESGG